MNLAELTTYTRDTVLKDIPRPYKWADTELAGWLNDAQSILARRTFCFVDGESDFTQITTVIGTASYALDTKILSIRQVVNADGYALRKLPSAMAGMSTAGVPRYWQQRGMNIVLSPSPDAEYVFRMIVSRLPLVPMQVSTDTPEIPEQYHRALADWAGYQALRNTDTQGDAKVAGLMVSLRKDWERAVNEIHREQYQNNFGVM